MSEIERQCLVIIHHAAWGHFRQARNWNEADKHWAKYRFYQWAKQLNA